MHFKLKKKYIFLSFSADKNKILIIKISADAEFCLTLTLLLSKVRKKNSLVSKSSASNFPSKKIWLPNSFKLLNSTC